MAVLLAEGESWVRAGLGCGVRFGLRMVVVMACGDKSRSRVDGVVVDG